jgi:hypothetical protein
MVQYRHEEGGVYIGSNIETSIGFSTWCSIDVKREASICFITEKSRSVSTSCSVGMYSESYI